MRKIKWFAAAVSAALTLAGVAGWVSSTTQARIDASVNSRTDASVRTDPFQMMIDATDLPTEQYVDYSVVFN